jgi:rhamnose transport system ATP-binding protein
VSEQAVPAQERHPFLSLHDVSKRFGGVQALRNITMQIQPGKILSLVGENGAGKSTLINIVSGLYSQDSGQILINGNPISWSHPSQALRRGIAVVHQELTLFGNLSVAENIYAGNPVALRRLGRLDRRMMREGAKEKLSLLGVHIDSDALVSLLTIAERQIVEIVKALTWDPRLLILDEATSALDTNQVKELFGVVRSLRDKEVAIVFVSHRMYEVLEISDQALVVKDGEVAGYYERMADVTEQDLVRCMVGYTVDTIFPAKGARLSSKPLLRARGLSNEILRDVAIEVYPGEIVGLGGLRGHGQESLLRTFFGIDSVGAGEIQIQERSYNPRKIGDAIAAGVAYVPPDRKSEGLALELSVEQNLTVSTLALLSNFTGHISSRSESEMLDGIRKRLKIDQREYYQFAGNLSGGNQQKVVLGKWLKSNVRLLLMDEPTRGIDIATKHQIYGFLRELASHGLAIVAVSTDSLELLGMSDRIYIFYEGRVHAELRGEDMTEERITYAIMGMKV